MLCRTGMIAVTLTTLLCTPVHSGSALLELEVGGQAYVGRSLEHDQDTCWLLGPDGRVHRIPLDRVTGYRKISETFRPISPSALRSSLREELGREYDVQTGSEFVVAAPRGETGPYAELLDDVYRSFVTFFSRRNLRLTEPEVPLVAIVFADAEQFAGYSRRDSVPYSPTLRGYYHPETNRVALYDPGKGLAARTSNERPGLVLFGPEPHALLTMENRGNVSASIRGGLRDTLVHEATHQLAFNMGLHTRIGENPKWVVEGLALVSEQQLSGRPRDSRQPEMNDEFYDWFNTRVRPEWDPGTLRGFLASDRPFATEMMNSYSLAWALTFYLSGRRSADFAGYLQAIRERNAAADYPPEERLSDFQRAFGDDVDWLEVQLLRYIDGLDG